MSVLDATVPVTRRRWTLVWLVLPFVLMGAAIAWLLSSDMLEAFNNGAPPIEKLTFERTVLDDAGLHVLVRAGGSSPMKVAQIQVDDAYWTFVQEPPGELARGASAWLRLPFPWVLGEAHKVKVLTSTGTGFEHEVAVAVPTPKPDGRQLAAQAMLGIFVGLVPIAIGLLFYPALRDASGRTMDFLLALTVGLLAFLLVDTLEDALEVAGAAAAIFQGHVMVVVAAAASFLTLMAVGRMRGAPTGLALAFFIALGIGLHNLGEGLAIGAAFAAGAAGLGTFLVIGFALHNVTEGVAIAAPILRERPSLPAFAGLVLVAGGPAVIGMWIGSLAAAPQWSALALAVGAGAILQVIVEVTLYLARRGGRGADAVLSPTALAGFLAGLGVMYGTAALVNI